MSNPKFNLVEAYGMLEQYISQLRTGSASAYQTFANLTVLANNVNSSIPGVVLKVPSVSELTALVPKQVIEEAFESSEEPYEEEPDYYESSYESSEC